MRVAILIPMLGKAGLIHEIRPLYQLPANRVILADDFAKIDGLSERYTNLTAPQGLLSDFLLDGNPAYDLIISLKPETGRSWEVPVSLAHWVLFHGHEIVVENPDVIIWATGGLQSDSKVYPTSYEVIRKLADSSDTLHKLGSARQFFLLPEGQDIEDVRNRYPDARVKGFWTLADAIAELADLKSARPAHTPLPANSVKTPKPGDALSKAKPDNRIFLTGIAIFGIVSGISYLYYFSLFDTYSTKGEEQRAVYNPPENEVSHSTSQLGAGKDKVQDDAQASLEDKLDSDLKMPLAEWLRITQNGSWLAGFHSMYRVSFVNQGPYLIEDISVYVKNDVGEGLLADTGLVLGPGEEYNGLIFFGVHPTNRSPKHVCISGKREVENIHYYEEITYQDYRAVSRRGRFGAPWPECEEIDFSYKAPRDQKECDRLYNMLGPLLETECSLLPEEISKASPLMPSGVAESVIREDDSVATIAEQDLVEALQDCTTRVLNEHFSSEAEFAEEAINAFRLLSKPTWSERDQIVIIGGELMAFGQGGAGVLERAVMRFCSDR